VDAVSAEFTGISFEPRGDVEGGTPRPLLSFQMAEDFAPMGLDGGSTRVGMIGYSGGSMPTGHAAELRTSCTPSNPTPTGSCPSLLFGKPLGA